MSESSTQELVDIYLTIREERARLKKAFDAEDAVLKTDMEQLEAAMLSICNAVGANSINTPSGTVIRSLKERAVCSDWDNFKKFVMENQLVDLLERRINQGNFKTFMKDNAEDGLPPGVNVMREYDISVRKSSN